MFVAFAEIMAPVLQVLSAHLPASASSKITHHCRMLGMNMAHRLPTLSGK